MTIDLGLDQPAAGRGLVGLSSTPAVTRLPCLYAIVHNQCNVDLNLARFTSDRVYVQEHKEGSFPPVVYINLFGWLFSRKNQRLTVIHNVNLQKYPYR